MLEHHGRQILSAVEGHSRFDHLPDLSGCSEPPKLMLLCGGDMMESFSVPNLWVEDQVRAIARDFGLVVFTREGSNPAKQPVGSNSLKK